MTSTSTPEINIPTEPQQKGERYSLLPISLDPYLVQVTHKCIVSNTDRLKPWVSWAQNLSDLKSVESWFTKMIQLRKLGTYFAYAIIDILPDTPVLDIPRKATFPISLISLDSVPIFKMIGITSFKLFQPFADLRTIEFGYWIDGDYSGHGITTTAVASAISAAITGNPLIWYGTENKPLFQPHRFEIRCSPSNIPSQNLAKRIGLLYEGTLRGEYWKSVEGPPIDAAIYAALSPEFDCENGLFITSRDATTENETTGHVGSVG